MPLATECTAGRPRAGSNLDRVRKELFTPLIERPHEIRLGMDRVPLTGKPFSSVSFKRKMLDVIIAGLLPMFDRERLAIVLAVEIGA